MYFPYISSSFIKTLVPCLLDCMNNKSSILLHNFYHHCDQLPALYNHRRIAGAYCGGAAVTKFPTKYLRIELCVESLLCEYK